MKTNATLQSTFFFNPEASTVSTWPTSRRSTARRVPYPRSLVTETQIGQKQETICGVILMLSLLFGLASVVAQFVLA